MSLDTEGGKVVHFPKNADVFQFDAEVSKIFPDMARRSIPMYWEGHRAHAAMLKEVFETARPPARILDIGASRGAFLRALISEYGESHLRAGDWEYTALDHSLPMVQYMQDDFSHLPIDVQQEDITTEYFLSRPEGVYDVVNMNYVLQFIHPADQLMVLRKVCALVKPGGVLILGQKDAFETMLGQSAHQEYMNFRVRNGYSREEIAAKTKALKGAMYPMNHSVLVTNVYLNGFREVYQTTRWMMFNTLYCIK